MHIDLLHEAAPEGVNGMYASGFKNAKNLGGKISKAMGIAKFGAKSKARQSLSPRRGRVGASLPPGPRINSSPVPVKPRHRKFFGMDKPQIPY